MLRHWTKVLVASALAFCCLPAMAESNESGSVTGAGQVVLHPKATILRFQLVLAERGDDMELTEKSLDRKGEAFRKALLAAKATPGSIRLGTPRLDRRTACGGNLAAGQQHWGKAKWQQQMQRQMPQQIPSQTRASRAESMPPPSQGRPPSDASQGSNCRLRLTADGRCTEPPLAELLVEADGIVRRVYEQMLPMLPQKKASEPAESGRAANQSANAPNAVANDPFEPGRFAPI